MIRILESYKITNLGCLDELDLLFSIEKHNKTY